LTNNKVKNIAASLRQRLLNIAKESGEDFSLILNRYGLERMLYRLSRSAWCDQFLLKGAMLFSIWEDDPHRPTRDADFLGFIDPETDQVRKIFLSLCDMAAADDGVVFDRSSIVVEEIRENNRYEGIRVRIAGALDSAKLTVLMDIGFGDVVTPGPVEVTVPTLTFPP